MPTKVSGTSRCHSNSCAQISLNENPYLSNTFAPMTIATASASHEMVRPTRSMNQSIPSASFSANVTSDLAKDFFVVGGFAVFRPLPVGGHVSHVGIVHFLGDRILGHCFAKQFCIRGTQCLDHRVRQRLHMHTFVLYQVIHRLSIDFLAPRFAAFIAGGARILDDSF